MFGTSPPFRVTPPLPVESYKTYRVVAPLATHWREATCAEVDCGPHLNGWVTILPAGDDRIALVKTSGRRFHEYRDVLPEHVAERLPNADPESRGPRSLGPGLIAFYFEPGQRCFEAVQHRLRVGRPELFIVRDGDHRGNPSGDKRVHTRAEDFVEDMAENQDRLKTIVERG